VLGLIRAKSCLVGNDSYRWNLSVISSCKQVVKVEKRQKMQQFLRQKSSVANAQKY
jgi:hypothetical protein